MPPVARQQAGPRESGAPLLACSGRSCYARCASACAALAHSDAQPQAPPGGQDTEETLKQACLQGYPEGARCVQSSVDSRNSAIHSAYRISLRPSSLPEPRHPSLKVVVWLEEYKTPARYTQQMRLRVKTVARTEGHEVVPTGRPPRGPTTWR